MSIVLTRISTLFLLKKYITLWTKNILWDFCYEVASFRTYNFHQAVPWQFGLYAVGVPVVNKMMWLPVKCSFPSSVVVLLTWFPGCPTSGWFEQWLNLSLCLRKLIQQWHTTSKVYLQSCNTIPRQVSLLLILMDRLAEVPHPALVPVMVLYWITLGLRGWYPTWPLSAWREETSVCDLAAEKVNNNLH